MNIECGKLIENVGIIIASVAATAASVVAIYGINAWRRELRGKKEHDLAEEVLALMYECRDRLRAIRSPFSSSEEGKTRKASPDESPQETELLNRAYITFERYKLNQEPFNRLFSIRYRFMALFGKEKAQPIEALQIALKELFTSAHMLPSYWRQQGRQFRDEESLKCHLAEMHKHEAIFWGTFSDTDEFDNRVNLIVGRMEQICANILRP